MSRATDLAKAEADAAEAEDAETPDAEPEPEPIQPDEEEEAEEEEPSEPSSLAQVENIDKALSAEQKRHAKALAKALGDQWEHFAMCPLCQVDGYAMPYAPGEISPEQRDAILTVMGEAGNVALKQHPDEVRCPECDGWGEMRNGSRRAEQETSACQKCMGTGHLDKSQLAPSNVREIPTPHYPWDEAQTPVVAPNADQWGRPMNHPDFGLDPSSIVSMARNA